ncbi:hypothetical protein L1987_06946 [Smallanthus sonchifolius]|uniref:Uncharacterized protein n=1 Tax=Smallanthus sonchifolius TaxID=185202 RepID=A0ACB9JZN4_9ASTR|nr:hypothetical protein L1987_06946 [Smallanthus sonchifolius]
MPHYEWDISHESQVSLVVDLVNQSDKFNADDDNISVKNEEISTIYLTDNKRCPYESYLHIITNEKEECDNKLNVWNKEKMKHQDLIILTINSIHKGCFINKIIVKTDIQDKILSQMSSSQASNSWNVQSPKFEIQMKWKFKIKFIPKQKASYA